MLYIPVLGISYEMSKTWAESPWWVQEMSNLMCRSVEPKKDRELRTWRFVHKI